MHPTNALKRATPQAGAATKPCTLPHGKRRLALSRRLSPLLSAVALSVAACGGATPAPDPTPPLPTPKVDEAAPPILVDRSQLPPPASAPPWAPPKVTEVQLASGAKLWHIKQGKTPLVSVQLVFPNGAATDPQGKEGLTQVTTDMLDEGAGALDALGLSEELQRLATAYGGRAGTDSVELGMSLLKSNFDASVKILADIVMRPKLTQKDFSRRKAELVTEAAADEKKSDVGRIAVVRRALFGKGYGSYGASGDRLSLAKLQLADIKRQHGALFSPTDATFIVVGDVELAQVKQSLDQAFDGWNTPVKLKPRPVEDKPLSGGVHLVDYPKATQSAVAIAVRAEPHDAKDYFAAEVYNWTLGGAFTSRLNMNLREEKGYTYGARSNFNRWREAGFYWLAAKVKSETTRASIDEMLKEVAQTCASRPLTEKERDQAVQGMLLGFPGDFESVSGTAMQLSQARIEGRGADWFASWYSSMAKVTLSEAQAVAKRYCDPAEFVVVIAGDRATVEPTLSGLERKLSVYDALGNPKR